MSGTATDKHAALRGMNEALEHARGLLRDARLLQRHRRTNNSLALSVLALGEGARVLYLAMVPDVERSVRQLTSSPDGLRLVLSPEWKTVFPRRRHKKPAASAHRGVIRALRTLAGYLEARTGDLDPPALARLHRLKNRCLLVSTGKPEDVPRPNNVPQRVATAAITLADSEMRDLARLRDAYRRGLVENLSEQLAQALYTDPRKQRWLRRLSIPRPASPVLFA